MVDLELHMEDDVMSHINLDGFFGDLPEAGDVIGAYSGLSWFDEVKNILMKDDDVHVLAEPGAKRAVPKGLKLPADLRFPGPSPPASTRLLQDAAAGPQVLRQAVELSFSLENNACGASVAKQESAVLSEPLPLGSLFWFLCITCLFTLPPLLLLGNPKPLAALDRVGVQTLDKSKRYKASRTKMKAGFLLS
ncbi:hypothetical protein ACJRO7_020794 [Eucalyptus globulus]|uniref:Uncharacterized protein n=1 Tax=Eucalyptus globulus TaxID=34317 RepID=A0ABD3KHN6_EUCGL